MKLFDWIKKTLGFDEDEIDDDDFFLNDFRTGDPSDAMNTVMGSVSLKREHLNVMDYRDRERFVRDHCEQMLACSKDIDEQKLEYQVVMEHLSDTELITGLSGTEYDRLSAKADKIIDIEESEKKYKRPTSKISEAQ